MGWIRPEDKLPPEGLRVLAEVSGSGTGTHGERIAADHCFYLATWIIPEGKTEDYAFWAIDTEVKLWDLTIHAWMPLPKHFEQMEIFEPEPDMMEHALFEENPDWLYKGEAVYEQMSLEDLFEGVT